MHKVTNRTARMVTIGNCHTGAILIRGPNNNARGPSEYEPFHPAGTGPIYIDRLVCMGNENALIDCGYVDGGNDHSGDAGVICSK